MRDLVLPINRNRVNFETDKLLDRVMIKGKSTPERDLLWCGSTENTTQGFITDRDVNADLNILRCATEDERPAILNRKKAKERLPDWKVGNMF